MKYFSIKLRFGTLVSLTSLFSLFFPHGALSQVIFDVEYTDSANFGFNDTTPVSTEGQNSATTLGAQRKQALEFSLDQFAHILHSDIPIHIEAGFDNYGGDSRSATLASAGPEWFNFNFRNAPFTDIAYPSALANKLSGLDLSDANSGISDIILSINADIDGSALGSSTFYYGLDANIPSLDIDFVTVISHELIHGLGFLSAIDPLTGHKFGCDSSSCRTNEVGDVYSTFLARIVAGQPSNLLDMTQSDRLSAVTAENQVVWTGSKAQAASASLSSGTINGMPTIYTPNPLEAGSSLSHTDFAIQATELMQAAYSGFLTTTPVNLAMLSDLGWGDTADLEVTIRVTETSADSASVVATVINNASSQLSDLNLSLVNDQGTISYQGQDNNLSCGTNGNQTLNCTLSSLAAQQLYQAAFTVNRSSSNTQPVSLYASIGANVLDTSPENNSDLVEVLEEGQPDDTTASSGTGVAPKSAETPEPADTAEPTDTSDSSEPPEINVNASTLQETQGGNTSFYLLFMLGFLMCRLRCDRKDLIK